MIGEAIKLKDGRKLGYASYGEPAGSPIVYCAGGIGTRLQVQPTPQYPIPPGIRLIGVDRPGMGLSDFQPGRTLLDWPEDVVQPADALGLDRFSVIGVSAGGPYALACAYKIPHRLKKCGLAAAETPIDGDRPMPGAARMMLWMYRKAPWFTRLWFWRADGRHVGKMEEQLAVLLSQPPRMSKLFCEKDRRLWSDPETRRHSLLDHLEAFRQGSRGPVYEAGLWGQPWGFRVEEIRFEKIYLWHGEKDLGIPVDSVKAMVAKLPHCEAHYYPEDGHSVGSYYWKEILPTIGL